MSSSKTNTVNFKPEETTTDYVVLPGNLQLISENRMSWSWDNHSRWETGWPQSYVSILSPSNQTFLSPEILPPTQNSCSRTILQRPYSISCSFQSRICRRQDEWATLIQASLKEAKTDSCHKTSLYQFNATQPIPLKQSNYINHETDDSFGPKQVSKSTIKIVGWMALAYGRCQIV
jgi:hypothetical protein